MTVHWVEQCLKASESLKDRPRSGKRLITNQEATEKPFENDPCQKITKLTQKKRISVSTVSRMVKKMSGKILPRSRKPLLSAAMAQKRLERSTRLLNDLKNHGNQILIFSDDKTFTIASVFNKQTDRRLGIISLNTAECQQPSFQPQS